MMLVVQLRDYTHTPHPGIIGQQPTLTTIRTGQQTVLQIMAVALGGTTLAGTETFGVLMVAADMPTQFIGPAPALIITITERGT